MLGELLRAAIESGDWTAVRARIDADAVLDMSNERGRQQISGADAIASHLAGPGPGVVHDWIAAEWDTGVALTFEWEGAGGIDRRRWYLRTDAGGRIGELWSTAARPTVVEAGAAPSVPQELLSALGITATATLSHGGNSGAALLKATGSDGSAYVLKRVTSGADWLARATDDQGRTAQLYEAGAFERMPASIGHGIVAVGRDGDAAWIAMRDVHEQLLSSEARLSRAQSQSILAAAAAMHHTFDGDVPAGAATLAARIGMSSPAITDAELAYPDLLPKQFVQGWDAFAELVDDDVAAVVLGHAANPHPLADGLLAANGGATLIHGDLRGDNLGFDGDTLVLIDWDLAAAGTPGVEFAWYLAHSAKRIDADHDTIEADHIAARGAAFDAREHDLGMLSGLVQYGWRIAHSARIHPDPAETAWGRTELAWWVPRVRAAIEHTG